MNACAVECERTRSALVIWRCEISEMWNARYKASTDIQVLIAYFRASAGILVFLSLDDQYSSSWDDRKSDASEKLTKPTLRYKDEMRLPSTCLFTMDVRVCNATSCWKDVLDELSLHETSSERNVDKLSTGMRTLKRVSD